MPFGVVCSSSERNALSFAFFHVLRLEAKTLNVSPLAMKLNIRKHVNTLL